MSGRLTAALVLLIVAGALDVGAHVVHAAALQEPAHVAALLGMVATLVAVLTEGGSRHRPTRP